MRDCIRRSAVARIRLALSAHAADIAAGKEKAEMCVGCHGENGISQIENIPSLAGQPDQFIQWQLVFFRAGTRKNEQMQPIVEQLNNEDIRNLGAYFASLPPPKADAGRQSGSVEEGRAGRRRPPLRLMPYRQLCRHQGGRPRRRPARGISGQGAARLQIRRARPAAAWRRWPTSPIPSAKRRSRRSRIISRICNGRPGKRAWRTTRRIQLHRAAHGSGTAHSASLTGRRASSPAASHTP